MLQIICDVNQGQSNYLVAVVMWTLEKIDCCMNRHLHTTPICSLDLILIPVIEIHGKVHHLKYHSSTQGLLGMFENSTMPTGLETMGCQVFKLTEKFIQSCTDRLALQTFLWARETFNLLSLMPCHRVV